MMSASTSLQEKGRERRSTFRALGLTKTYRTGEVEVHALRGVNLELYQSELVVLLGPSGSGKSTLLNILAIGVLIVTAQWIDSINHMVEVYFFDSQHQHMTVGLVEPRSKTVLHEFEHLPGVLSAEPMRGASADLRAGPYWHRGAVQGMPSGASLMPVYDAGGKVVDLPPDGLVLSTKLAEKLNVGLGDEVIV